MVEICLTKVLIISIILQIALLVIVCKLMSNLGKASVKYDSEHEYCKQLLNGGLFVIGMTLLVLIISVMYIYNNDNGSSIQPDIKTRVSFKNIDYL